jgi:membrane protease YdiL (CAAX protease family)
VNQWRRAVNVLFWTKWEARNTVKSSCLLEAATYAVKTCDYCGKANEDTLLFCAGCGTDLKESDEARMVSLTDSAEKNLPRTLNARIATIIFVVYVAVQVVGGALMTEVASAIAAAQGIHNPRQVKLILETLDPTGLILSFMLGGIVMVFTAFKLIPKQLKDTSPTGAAWVLGRWDAVRKGLVIGLIIGVCDQTFILVAKHFVAWRNLDPVTRMANTPGLPQAVWIVGAVLLAPFVEEMMFRGVLYGGYRKSFGPVWAAVSTTFIFVAIHFSYYIHAPSNAIGIIVVTLVMLWCRLHWNAIGPAIAVHIGYNFMAALVTVLWTWHR